jgi:hypothetical protein
MGIRAGTVFARHSGMAQTAEARPLKALDPGSPSDKRIRIGAECLELDAGSQEELTVLRAWIRRINGTTYAQPYLVEGPPGHFSLYVGEAAERARTARGIQ